MEKEITKKLIVKRALSANRFDSLGRKAERPLDKLAFYGVAELYIRSVRKLKLSLANLPTI